MGAIYYLNPCFYRWVRLYFILGCNKHSCFLGENGEEMHTALVVVLSALATGFLVALLLSAERWEWYHGY
jgi:hypothetical protein